MPTKNLLAGRGMTPEEMASPEEHRRIRERQIAFLIDAAHKGMLAEDELAVLWNVLRSEAAADGALREMLRPLFQAYGVSLDDTTIPWMPGYRLWLQEALPGGFTTTAPHIKAIAEAVDGLMRRQPLWDRLMLFIPPRHGKTTNASVYGSLYFMLHYPATTVLLTSNTQRNAETLLSRPARAQAMLRGWIDKSKVGVDEWHMKNGSVALARGVGSPPIGRGVHLLVIDDPIKSSEEAESQTFRDKAWQWYVTDIWQRLEPNARVLMIMARWNEDDVAARALAVEPDRWKVLRFPVLAEPDDPLGRAPGEALWPERYDKEYWHEERRKLESAGQIRTWYALWMQDPRPAAGECYFDLEFLQACMDGLAGGGGSGSGSGSSSEDRGERGSVGAKHPVAIMEEGAEGFHGAITIWEYPYPEKRPLAPGAGYVAGADVASGLTLSGRADYSTLMIARTDTREVVLTYRGKPTPQEFALDIKRLCTEEGWYLGCIPCVERNNHGLVVCAALEEWGMNQYRHPVGEDSLGKAVEVTAAGYPTTVKTKAVIDAGLRYGIATAAHVWRRGTLPLAALEHAESDAPVFWDLDTYRELIHYVEKPGGKREGASGYHDDLVRALALTHFMLQSQKPRTMVERPAPRVRYLPGTRWMGWKSERAVDVERGVAVLPLDDDNNRWTRYRASRRR